MNTNPKTTILEILVYKIRPVYAFQLYYKTMFTRTRKDFRFYYFWLYFVYQNFQNGYFRIKGYNLH